MKGLLKFFLSFLAALLTLFLADYFLEGVEIESSAQSSLRYWQILIFLGFWLAFFNFFIKPILNKIFFPLTLLTFGIFSIILNMAIFLVFDAIFVEIKIKDPFSLFLTTMIFFLTNLLANLLI